MIHIITALSTNLFRMFITKRFMEVFFRQKKVNKVIEKFSYFLFFISTSSVHLIFEFPPLNIATNIVVLYLVSQIYIGEQKKKLLISLLIYGINMICDVISAFSLANYRASEDYAQSSAYVTVFLISICEFIIERFVMRKREEGTSPYTSILMTIPVISIIILCVMTMENLNNRIILVGVSTGILIINLVIFYLYNALLDTYLQLEESSLLERQIACYANELDVLMQSEEKVSALRHDMKHHLNELLCLAKKEKASEIVAYLNDMQIFMTNKYEYVCSGNKEVDSILNYMLNKAERALSNVEYKVHIPKEISIRAFDLNIIFGNLLDNAISAAKNSKLKWLYISFIYEKGLIFINIKNSYSGKLIKKFDNYRTTKGDIKSHGYGLKNVKRVVEEYEGDMQILDENNIFDVRIMLFPKAKSGNSPKNV